jgi:hypothetical protein
MEGSVTTFSKGEAPITLLLHPLIPTFPLASTHMTSVDLKLKAQIIVKLIELTKKCLCRKLSWLQGKKNLL